MSRRHNGIEGSSGVEDQAQIFVHELHGELRTVVIVRGADKLSHMSGSDHGGLTEDLEEKTALQSSFLAEGTGFGNGLHADTEQSVHYQLHGCAGTAGA